MKIVDKYMLLRLGGLPYDTVAGLRSPHIEHAFDAMSRSHLYLETHREQISDALHEAIGKIAVGKRTPVIALRRELFKGNFIRAYSLLRQLDAESAAVVAEQVPQAVFHTGQLREHAQSISRRFDEALLHERRTTTQLSDEHDFMDGVAISAPNLVPAIQRLQAHIEDSRVDKRDKKAERSLHSYVLRAATKTSPFSTLGPVAIMCPERGPAGPRKVSRASVYPIARVLNHLHSDPKRLAGLDVRISPYVTHSEDSVSVGRTAWEFKDIDSRKEFAACVESSVQIKQKPLINAVQAIAGSTTIPLGSVAHTLSERSGIAIDTAYSLLGDLLRLGFLEVPDLSIHPYDGDLLLETVRNVQESDPSTGGLMMQYLERSEEFSTVSGAAERSGAILDLGAIVGRLYEQAGLEAKLPRSILYEDMLVSADPLSHNFDEEVSDDTTRALIELLDVLDDSNVKHALMVGYFHSLGQASVGADSFVENFIQELFSSFEAYNLSAVDDDGLAEDPWLRWGEAWRWVLARRRLADQLAVWVTVHSPAEPVGTGAGVESIDIRPIISEVLADVPHHHPEFRHANLLVQRTGDGQWILNDAFGGVGFQVSRFSHLLEESAQSYTQDVVERAGKHSITIAELSGGALFSNLNLHDQLFTTTLVIPGEPLRQVSGDLGPRTLHLEDLTVRYCGREGRLILTYGSQTVHPMYSGYLISAATPRRSQVLSLFTPSSQFSKKIPDLISTTPTSGQIIAIPRFTVDNVVVSRARVLVHGLDLPVANPLEEAGYRSWINAWIELGLPPQCFVRIRDGSSPSRKPHYFDIRQILSCSTLSNDLKQAQDEAYVELMELLPDTVMYTHDGRHTVTEQMIGLSWVEDLPCQH